MKKIISFVMALLIVSSCVPTAFAADSNLASGCDYTISHTPQYGDSGGELTDGRFGAMNFYDERWVGLAKVTDGLANITLDLGAVKDFDRVELTFLNSASSGGILFPDGDVIVSYSDSADGEFELFSKVSVPATVPKDSVYELGISGEFVRGRFIKIEFKAVSWVFISEIEVYDNSNSPVNLALCKKYYSLPSSQNTAQPDENECELTDGIRASTSDNTDPAWVWLKQDYQNVENHAGSKTVIQSYVIDLQNEMYVSQVDVRFISKGFGGSTEFPWTVWTYASAESGDTLPESWFMLSRQWDVSRAWSTGALDFGWRSGWSGRAKLNKVDAIPGYSTVKTRYIRVDIEVLRNAALDEIEVFGYTKPQNGAYVVTDGKDLDNAYDYLTPDETGVKDMALCYNGYYGSTRGIWTAEMYRPYLTYVDKNGNAVDTMFDTICLLGINGPTGIYNKDVANKSEPQNASDWHWYLDKTFNEENGDAVALGRAAEIAAQELGDPDYKVQLVVMHPGADGQNGTNFGPLDGNYYDVTFDSVSGSDYHIYPTNKKGWQLASDWWFDEVIERFESGKAKGLYDHVELVGFYYLSEQIGFIPAAPKYHIDRAHELGYKIFFIPFNFANGYHWADDLGFDGVAIQPNHFFGDMYEDGGLSELKNDYIDTVAYSANYAHTGIEMEFDDRVYQDYNRYNLWLDYLNGVLKNKMDGDNAHRAWYQAVDAMYKCSVSTNPVHRSVYDYSYQLMKGIYTEKEYIESFDVTIGYNLSGAAVQGAVVELLKDGEVVAFASSNGKYYFTDIDPDSYTLRVSKDGYATREYEITVDGDTVADTEIRLYGDVTGDGLINNADVFQINRKGTNNSSVFDLQEDYDYRLKVANVTALTGNDTLINNSDVLQINRKTANFSSIFDMFK